jgi:uncharacterized protein (TIGR03435 family)
LLRVAVTSVLSLAVSFAQAPAAKPEPPRFDVASIRPSNPDEVAARWSGITNGLGRTDALNVTLKGTIADAYGIREDRILGGPAWAESDRYRILAKAEPPAGQQPAGNKVVKAMLRTLLAERFNLKLHRETRPGEVLILGLAKATAKGSPKLQLAADGPSSYHNGHGILDAPHITMHEFAEVVSHDLRLEVVDRTGLKGAFNFTLRYNADPPSAGDRIDAAADLRFEWTKAIAEQLGLSLKPERARVEVLVIDHAERPTEN